MNTLQFAERLANLRKERGLSQEMLAEKLNVSRQAISKWERGEAMPDTDNLIALAALYEISLDDLVQGGHTHAKKKESVHIGFDGIHVETEKESVHIGRGGIHIEDENNALHIPPEEQYKLFKPHSAKQVVDAISLLLIVISYILMGAIYGLWHPGWLVFLGIPLISSLTEAIQRRNANHFAYPVLATLIYLILGLCYGNWHPSWVVFLTIPLYYFTVNFVRDLQEKAKKAKQEENIE